MRAAFLDRLSEHLLRGLYSAALYLLLPVTLYHLVWRGFRQRAYLLRWHERYARYGDANKAASLWAIIAALTAFFEDLDDVLRYCIYIYICVCLIELAIYDGTFC